ncbi:glycosyltransferase [Euzebya tangerina]|uniref:glycosyltransferase n=1 Tax=Euzebya tangerina TaxID=591198 RepID=UPI000E3200B3|nr:glycosyltransferase [Euzebya tangerina]
MSALLMACLDPGIAWGGSKGASVHLEQLARAIAAEDTQVCVCVTRIADGAQTRAHNLEVLEIPGPQQGADLATRLDCEGDRAAWLAETAQARGVSAIYERLALHTTAASRAARHLGLPHLVEMNAPLREEASRFRTLERPEVADRAEQEVLRHAALVLPVSEPLVTYARSRGATAVELTPNAVNAAMFPRAARPDRADPTAIFVGALRPWHGPEVLAEAWRSLGADAPRLVVVGDGPGRHHLQSVGAELLGTVPHDDVPELLRQADLAVAPGPADMPTYFSPLKVFEYMAAGLPVVASDLPGTRQVLSERGVLVPAGDASALAAAVAALQADPDRRAQLGAAGRREVLSNHTWPHRARTVLAHVDGLAATPTASVELSA